MLVFNRGPKRFKVNGFAVDTVDVVIDRTEGRVVHLELAGQRDLGSGGHADDVTVLPQHGCLGRGFETGTLRLDVRSPRVQGDRLILERDDDGVPEVRGELADPVAPFVPEKGNGIPGVDEVVRDQEGSRFEVRVQGSGGLDGEDRRSTGRLERPEVGVVIDAVGSPITVGGGVALPDDDFTGSVQRYRSVFGLDTVLLQGRERIGFQQARSDKKAEGTVELDGDQSFPLSRGLKNREAWDSLNRPGGTFNRSPNCCIVRKNRNHRVVLLTVTDSLQETMAAYTGTMMDLTPGTSGDYSLRQGARAAITPTGLKYARLSSGDFPVLDLENGTAKGTYEPSSETPTHRILYRRLQCGAIVHVHSPWATTIASLEEPLSYVHYAAALAGPEVPVVEYHTYGTEVLANAIYQEMERAGSSACLLANHGLVAVGDTLEDAFDVAEAVEFTARIEGQARMIGEPNVLSEDEVLEVTRKFTEYGQDEEPEADDREDN